LMPGDDFGFNEGIEFLWVILKKTWKKF
jgi:hypothetical protein